MRFAFSPAVLLTVCLAGLPLCGHGTEPLDLPTGAPADRPGALTVSELPDRPDAALQQQLEALVRREGLWEPVQSRRLALGLVDITDIDAPRYAALNPNHMMYAASLPKIAILLDDLTGIF
jgi:hypothetical protein